MISKIAIQVGLGVTAVGGVAGAVTYALWDSSVEYLVEVPAGSGNDQPTEKITEKDKNYFCKWGTIDPKKEDQNCIIKKIKLDTAKKLVSLYDISENKSDSFEAITNENLKAEKNWFLLKIKGYDSDLESSNIDILSNAKTGNDKGKKYTTVALRFKLENNRTKTFFTKFTSTQPSEDIGTTYKCKLTTTAQAVNIQSSDSDLKPCDVYKLGTDKVTQGTNSKITKFDISGATKVTTKTDFTKDNYYIITFTADDQNINLLTNDSMVVCMKEGNTNKKVGDFKVINPMVGEVKTDITASNLILLN